MSNKITTVLVDDEPGSLATLEQLIHTYCPDLLVVGKAMNPIQARELIDSVQPQLVFLDIEMPYGNAFDMLDQMGDIKFEVVFVTAYNNYALKAFRYAAADYLLKPLNIDELVEAVNKISRRLSSNTVNNRIHSLLENLQQKSEKFRKIILPTNDGFLVEDVSQIMYLNAEGSYTTKLLTDGVRRIAQKVGEEGVETALAAVAQDTQALSNEAADLLFHLLVLLHARGLALADVEHVLSMRRH